jgi:hypothetical protein
LKTNAAAFIMKGWTYGLHGRNIKTHRILMRKLKKPLRKQSRWEDMKMALNKTDYELERTLSGSRPVASI